MELTEPEFRIFKKLASPEKIQDFLNVLPMNFKDTCRSPLMALRAHTAQCMEGAMLAAAALWHNDAKPLLMDLRSAKHDDDHAVALFRYKGRWGAISKTNHPVLRYRDPIYKSPRELAMSYFNEYFLDSGEKTLESYTSPFSLVRFGKQWLTSHEELWYIDKALTHARHYEIVNGMKLRPADKIEIQATKKVEWKK